jgi:AAA domain
MPSLADHQSNEYVKALVTGDSGSGKTGSLASLARAGYKLRILDFDNGLDVLKQYILKDCPEAIGNIEYRTLRDKRKATETGLQVSEAKAYINALKMLDKWSYSYGGQKVDLGTPATWGPECILVIDSLTRLCDAAFDYYEPLVPKGKSGEKDNRSVYYNAQQGIAELLALITGEDFRTNVIVMAHIRYVERQDGVTKGYPRAVGSALSPDIPTYFNSVIQAETDASGKRKYHTIATAMCDLKNPRPFAMASTYPIGEGLASFFEVLLNQGRVDKKPKPEPVADATPVRRRV